MFVQIIDHTFWSSQATCKHQTSPCESHGPSSYCYNLYRHKNKQRVANTIIKQGSLGDRYARMGYATIMGLSPVMISPNIKGDCTPNTGRHTRAGGLMVKLVLSDIEPLRTHEHQAERCCGRTHLCHAHHATKIMFKSVLKRRENKEQT